MTGPSCSNATPGMRKHRGTMTTAPPAVIMRLHVHAVSQNAYCKTVTLQKFIVCEGVYNDKNYFRFRNAVRVRAVALRDDGLRASFRGPVSA